MIDSRHKMAGLVAHLMQYYRIEELCQIRFPAEDPTETPPGLGFAVAGAVLSGMSEDWSQRAHLTGERPVTLHLCKDADGKWFAYVTPD